MDKTPSNRPATRANYWGSFFVPVFVWPYSRGKGCTAVLHGGMHPHTPKHRKPNLELASQLVALGARRPLPV